MKRVIEQHRAAAQAERVALVELEDGKTITPRNVAVRVATNGSYQLEATASGRPSRKSTRTSSSRVKADAGLRVKTMQAQTAPSARNERRV